MTPTKGNGAALSSSTQTTWIDRRGKCLPLFCGHRSKLFARRGAIAFLATQPSLKATVTISLTYGNKHWRTQVIGNRAWQVMALG
jgi:hypothetical protein